MFLKAVAVGLLLAVCLIGRRVEGQRRGKKIVSGDSLIYLGQDRNPWKPLIRTAANISEIRSIKSTFQFRTYDPEGVIFYGDSGDAQDWFILSLKDGFPLMQISKGDVQVSVTGGPKLNDGIWHTLDVGSKGKFVVLDVDNLPGLVVGMHSQQTKEVVSGQIRLALGGLLASKDKMIVELDPQMDGCVRDGRWLNLSMPWEVDEDELLLCHQNIQPGSYFAQEGFSLFNTSVFDIDEESGLTVGLSGNFSQMDGTLLSVMSSEGELLGALRADNKTNKLHVTIGKHKDELTNNCKRLQITFLRSKVEVLQTLDKSIAFSYDQESTPGYITALRGGRLAIGGLLGDREDMVGSHFLTGCLEKIQIQGNNIDLDTALKDKSASSHSCPV
ncbi:PREDICTED: sex hormone-binding globulin [Cyprinodon variegatus]|uniref:Sex hormone-binding globulin n=1 Tax=Cyprinodon variegatus TaxID=28743 RepID=A0A3Q2GC30_CYPVA|nr:PREDICTED: sex hormone-binding globulin [Cyprinodon variegatus]